MMLEVAGLAASYGESQVLFGVCFAVERGEVVTLLGRNGMGKTTTISARDGDRAAAAAARSASRAERDPGLPPYRDRAPAAWAWCPRGARSFPT